jgi:Phage integrase central domain/Arm DNA-binding domain
MPLTDIAVRKAKGRATPHKLADGGGLYLLVRSGDARYWRMDYRWAGKRRTLALGVYPSVSLATARERRDQARKLLASGVDPSAQRKLERLVAKAAADNTFRLISDEWMAKLAREGRADATLGKVKWLLELAYSEIGERPVAAITPPELLTVLRRVEARGHYETARRLRSTCGQLFRYAIATGRATRDPSADLRGALTAPKVKHRAAVIEPKAVGALLRAIDGYDGQPITLAALRLAPLVFVRPGELRRAEWTEFDLDGAEWRIPGAKMKMGCRTGCHCHGRLSPSCAPSTASQGAADTCSLQSAASRGRCRRIRSTPHCGDSATARTRRLPTVFVRPLPPG